MQMVVQRKNIKTIQEDFKKELPRAFFDQELRDRIREEQQRLGFSESTRQRLVKAAEKLTKSWGTSRRTGTLYSFVKEQVSHDDILSAWCRRDGCYVSHNSALYYNDLVDQRPKNFFLSCEKKSKSSSKKPNDHLQTSSVHQAFLKEPRWTRNYFDFSDGKYFLIEKLWLGGVGVNKMLLGFENQHIRVTSIERTLIDCVTSPHYAGGIGVVAKAFSNVTVDSSALLKIYNLINPVYPIWQSIGLILELTGNYVQADEWENSFSNSPKLPFFIEHSAKSHWQLSERWAVSYPRSLGENRY